tara:strand:- start:2333 stop:2692 length:360 start_codon:yes stop_codon:yes gene_type:complete
MMRRSDPIHDGSAVVISKGASMMKVLCDRAANCESGATSIEYAVTAAVFSVAVLLGAETLRTAVSDQYAGLAKKIAPPPQGSETRAAHPASPGARLIFISVEKGDHKSGGMKAGARPPG